ncbi:MAG TPA: TolC family protein [Thermoanaerobaculia bacterium]|nr:TolC family protein [Thermoanaerobaculia bacterium]
MRLALSIGLALLTAGCATTNPQGSFEAASQPVSERSGLATAWPRSPADSELALAHSRALLAQPLTPESAAQVALLRNPGLFARLEELGISQADYAQATRISNPSLELSARRPNEGGLATNVEAGLIQDLLDPLLLPLRKRFAAAELEMVKLSMGQAMLDLVAETKMAFAEHQAAARRVERLGVIVEIEEAAVAFAERQRQAGNLPQLELEEQQALLAETRAEKVHAELEARAAQEGLQRLLGLAGADLGWTAAQMLPEPPADELATQDLEALALEGRLDVAAARAAVGLVEKALSLRRANRFFPGGVRVGISREREPDRLRVTGPVLELELPIFDTGAASIARLEAEHRRAERQLEELTILVRSEVRELADRYVASRDLARFYRDTVLPGRVRILDETLRHYNAMLKGVYDLLMVKRLEIEAEKAAIEAWRDAWVARYALERALGGRFPAAAPAAGPAPEPHHDHHEHHDHHAPGGHR